jgi:hypothetical protein
MRHRAAHSYMLCKRGGHSTWLVAMIPMSSLVTDPNRYTADLQQLGLMLAPHPVAMELGSVTSPLTNQLQQWIALLSSHPDRAFTEYILSGLQSGFRVGFEWGRPLESAKRNMLSVQAHPEVVDRHVDNELAALNFVGPLACTMPQLSNGQTIHISRIGIIPKGHNSGRWL